MQGKSAATVAMALEEAGGQGSWFLCDAIEGPVVVAAVAAVEELQPGRISRSR
jgi:hypothetical protein